MSSWGRFWALSHDFFLSFNWSLGKGLSGLLFVEFVGELSAEIVWFIVCWIRFRAFLAWGEVDGQHVFKIFKKLVRIDIRELLSRSTPLLYDFSTIKTSGSVRIQDRGRSHRPMFDLLWAFAITIFENEVRGV